MTISETNYAYYVNSFQKKYWNLGGLSSAMTMETNYRNTLIACFCIFICFICNNATNCNELLHFS